MRFEEFATRRVDENLILDEGLVNWVKDITHHIRHNYEHDKDGIIVGMALLVSLLASGGIGGAVALKAYDTHHQDKILKDIEVQLRNKFDAKQTPEFRKDFEKYLALKSNAYKAIKQDALANSYSGYKSLDGNDIDEKQVLATIDRYVDFTKYMMNKYNIKI